jgi:peptide/nickel transport system permease protein
LTAFGGDPKVSASAIAELRQVYGLDQPFAVRYARWLGAVARGDFGSSFYFQLPVGQILWPRLLRTAALAFVSLAIASGFALSLGITAARRRGGWADRACSALVLFGSSTPRLVLALVVLTLMTRLGSAGSSGPVATLTVGGWLLRLLPAALVLCVPLVALFLAQSRSSIAAGLNCDFVRVARAKGLPEAAILLRHVLRPSLNPLITVFGYSLGGVMSGSVVVEKVLGWPGLGELSVTAVHSRDVPLLLGVVMITATAVLLGNLLADLLLRLNDPRL